MKTHICLIELLIHENGIVIFNKSQRKKYVIFYEEIRS